METQDSEPSLTTPKRLHSTALTKEAIKLDQFPQGVLVDFAVDTVFENFCPQGREVLVWFRSEYVDCCRDHLRTRFSR